MSCGGCNSNLKGTAKSPTEYGEDSESIKSTGYYAIRVFNDGDKKAIVDGFHEVSPQDSITYCVPPGLPFVQDMALQFESGSGTARIIVDRYKAVENEPEC